MPQCFICHDTDGPMVQAHAGTAPARSPHEFHSACLLEWVQASRSLLCPLCHGPLGPALLRGLLGPAEPTTVQAFLRRAAEDGSVQLLAAMLDMFPAEAGRARMRLLLAACCQPSVACLRLLHERLSLPFHELGELFDLLGAEGCTEGVLFLYEAYMAHLQRPAGRGGCDADTVTDNGADPAADNGTATATDDGTGTSSESATDTGNESESDTGTDSEKGTSTGAVCCCGSSDDNNDTLYYLDAALTAACSMDRLGLLQALLARCRADGIPIDTHHALQVANQFGHVPLLRALVAHAPVHRHLLAEHLVPTAAMNERPETLTFWLAEYADAHPQLVAVAALTAARYNRAACFRAAVPHAPALAPLRLADCAEALAARTPEMLALLHEHGLLDRAAVQQAEPAAVAVPPAAAGCLASLRLLVGTYGARLDGAVLVAAAKGGHTPVLEYLAQLAPAQRAALEPGGSAAFYWAARHGHLPALRCLVRQHAFAGLCAKRLPALHDAAGNGYRHITEYLAGLFAQQGVPLTPAEAATVEQELEVWRRAGT